MEDSRLFQHFLFILQRTDKFSPQGKYAQGNYLQGKYAQSK